MQLKKIFFKKGYDNKFFDKIYPKKVPQHTVLTDLCIFLPYLGKQDQPQKKLSETFFFVSI